MRTSRVERHGLRRWLWAHSTISAVRGCGRYRRKGSDHVTVKRHESGRAGFGGVERCASPWACPECAMKLGEDRSKRIADVVEFWLADQARDVLFVTLTVRHRRGMTLASVWSAVAAGWRAATRGANWKTFGVDGWIRVTEVTYGRHGWHVHVHALLNVPHQTDSGRAALTSKMWRRWDTAVQAEGLPGGSIRHGLDVRVVGVDVGLGDYLQKLAIGVAREAARGDGKDAARGGRTPWDILRDAAAGDLASRKLWLEWEQSSKGRRQILASRGLWDRCAFPDEAEVVNSDAGGEVVTVLSDAEWAAVTSHGLEEQVLELAESGGPAAVIGFQIHELLQRYVWAPPG